MRAQFSGRVYHVHARIEQRVRTSTIGPEHAANMENWRVALRGKKGLIKLLTRFTIATMHSR
jgi:hypothetical protein